MLYQVNDRPYSYTIIMSILCYIDAGTNLPKQHSDFHITFYVMHCVCAEQILLIFFSPCLSLGTCISETASEKKRLSCGTKCIYFSINSKFFSPDFVERVKFA